MAALGADEETIEQWRDRPEETEEEITLWPENVPAVRLFLALGTQWRGSGLGGAGLDYAAIPPTAAMMEIPMSPALFDKLQIMEATVRKELRRE